MDETQYWKFNAQFVALRVTILALTRLSPDTKKLREEFEDYAQMQIAMFAALPTSEAAIEAIEQQIAQMRDLIWGPGGP